MEDRDQFGHARRVAGPGAHKNGPAVGNEKEAGDVGTAELLRVGMVGDVFPVGSQVRFHLATNLLHLIEIVTGRWHEHADDQIPIPLGQVLGRRHQFHTQPDRNDHHRHHDRHAAGTHGEGDK